jgi:hypothetical protein
MFGLNSTVVAVHNWAALRYPAWVSKPGGIEMFGTGMMIMIIGLVIVVLALIVPAITAVSAFAGMGMSWGRRAYIPAAAGALVGMYVQLGFVLMRVGIAYDRMDPAERTLTT